MKSMLGHGPLYGPERQNKLRVFIADDHPIVLRGLVSLFDECEDLQVVGSATNGREVLTALDTRRPEWDVLLLDLSLPRVGGAEVLRRVLDARPSSRVIIVSMYPEEQHAAPLLAAGASAYFSKTRPPEELVDLVRDPRANHATPRASVSPTARMAHHDLSSREHQVFMLLIEGNSVSEIAAQLDILPSTVSNHLTKIRQKIDVRTVAEIVNYAHRVGLVD